MSREEMIDKLVEENYDAIVIRGCYDYLINILTERYEKFSDEELQTEITEMEI